MQKLSHTQTLALAKRADLDKKSGLWSEYLGANLSPVNLLTLGIPNLVGAGAAAWTDTRNREEQVEAEKDSWSNWLVPGKAYYNLWKRMGYQFRGEGSTLDTAKKQIKEEKEKEKQRKTEEKEKEKD